MHFTFMELFLQPWIVVDAPVVGPEAMFVLDNDVALIILGFLSCVRDLV
jgi:hypothetical protein